MSDSKTPLILLDTHAWFWLLNGDDFFNTKKLQTLIRQTAAESKIKVAVISIWELGMLEAKERIRFQTPFADWVNQALTAPGLTIAPFTPEIAIESTRLPGAFHGDPADRIIVATARKIEATILTRDEKILRYASEKYVRAIEI